MDLSFTTCLARRTPFTVGAFRKTGLRLLAAVLALAPPAALASPDCSAARLQSSAACVTKLDYCKHTSIVLVLAVRGRASGVSESNNVRMLTDNNTNEIWYRTYRSVITDIVHQVYTKDPTYRKLRARIAPNMALALPALTQGCNADPSVTVAP